MFELINPYVAKIVISAKDGDSIRSISKRIRESYGWTYKWISELEKIGVLKRKRQEIHINKENAFYKEMSEFVTKSIVHNLNLNDTYLLPNLTGLDYIFTNTDAVFIWTKGGYNIGRSRNSYPIFIGILKKDKTAWENYFSQFGDVYAFQNERRTGIYYVISTSKSMDIEYCDDIPVWPLAKTVEWAKKYRFNFEPALEMLDEMYNLKIGIKYSGT
ncbi:MAG: hypothetical protein ABIF10_00200 [Candidatus Woesearchaeota archaeon]